MADKEQNDIREANRQMAEQALRVLAAAYLELPDGKEEIETRDIEGNLVFLGLFGMADPPREEARRAIEGCKKAGIRVVMITGDNKITAQSIAGQLGLTEGGAMTGQELEHKSDRNYSRKSRE